MAFLVEAYLVGASLDNQRQKVDSLADLDSLHRKVGSLTDSSAVASVTDSPIQRERELMDIDLHTDSAGPAVENIAL